MSMTMQGVKDEFNLVDAVFQIANINRPLLSVSKICSRGDVDVLCKQHEALIVDTKGKVCARFEEKNGLYVTTVNVKNPRRQGFHRPAP